MSHKAAGMQDRCPLQAVSLSNTNRRAAPPKTPKQQKGPLFQWVLMDDLPPVQVKMCSVSLDLLHTCERCDKDFATLERLMVN